VVSEGNVTLPARTRPAGRVSDVDLRGRGLVVPLTGVAALGVAAIWLVDISTGPEYGFAVFYLLPIGLATWFAGWRKGVLMAGLGSLMGGAVE